MTFSHLILKVESQITVTTIESEADKAIAWLNLPFSAAGKLPDGTWWACDENFSKQSIGFGATLVGAILECKNNISEMILL